ncbi:MAG: hypothetical protein GY679_05600, partial [Mycoplasma sp.]|nr:hypothetical protein [Mycoplasma sp.]
MNFRKKLFLKIGALTTVITGTSAFLFSQNNIAENIKAYNSLQTKVPNFLSKLEIKNKLSKLKNGETAKINDDVIRRVIHNFSTGFYSEQKQNLKPYNKTIEPFSKNTQIILKNKNSFNSTNLKLLSGISISDFNNNKDVIVIDGNNKLIFRKKNKGTKNKMFSGTIDLENYENIKVAKLSENKFVVLDKETSKGKYILKKQALKEMFVEQKKWIVNGNNVYFIKSFKMDGWIKNKNNQILSNIKTFNNIWLDLHLKTNTQFIETSKNEWLSKKNWFNSNHNVNTIYENSPLDKNLKLKSFDNKWLRKKIGTSKAYSNVSFANISFQKIKNTTKTLTIFYQLKINGEVQSKIHRLIVKFKKTIQQVKNSNITPFADKISTDVTSVDLSKFELEGDTMHIGWKNKPSFKGYHYEFQLGASDNVWKTWDVLVKAAKAKELFWAPGTGNNGPTWIAKDLKIKLVANSGYELKTATGKVNETPVTSVDVSKFSSFKRFITKKMVDELIDIFDKEFRAHGNSKSLSWTTGNILNFIKNHGFKKTGHLNVYYLNKRGMAALQIFDAFIKTNHIDRDMIEIGGSIERTLSLVHLDSDWAEDGFIVDPSTRKQFELKKSGYATIPMYVDASSIDMNFELSGTTTKLDNLTHKSSSVKGYTPDFLYSIDNGQNWITKDELMKLYDGVDVNKNLWVPGTKTEKGKWLASTNGNILVKLKPTQYIALSTEKKTSIPLSSFKKLLKFIPDGTADSILAEIKKDVKVDGGNFKKVIWKPIQAIIDFAENAGLLIEFAISKDGKYSSDLPEQVESDQSKRQLWVRINPKPGFAISSNKNQNNKTDITTTSDILKLKQEVDVTSVDLSKFELEGDTKHIEWKNKPSFKGYHYEFQLGASDNVWKTWDALVTATTAKELFWAPGTGNNGPTWIAKDLKIKLVAEPGYELKTATGKVNETPATSADISKFSSFKRYVTSKMISDLKNLYDKQFRVTGNTHAMSWSFGNILNYIKNHGFKKPIFEVFMMDGNNTTHSETKSADELLNWKSMPSTSPFFRIDEDLNNGVTRRIRLNDRDTMALIKNNDIIIDPGADLNWTYEELLDSDFSILPMYIDTSPIDMNFELSGTTIKLDNLTHKSSSVKGYTPDFLYSIDNGQNWITKDELMKLYDGGDASKNLWVPGTKTEKGKWLDSTNGNILVKLQPAAYTVLSTEKKTSIPLSSFKKLLKFISDGTADSMIEEIKKDVKVDGGNNNKVTWKSIQAVIDFAENAGLLIEFARSKDGKYSSDLPEQLDP